MYVIKKKSLVLAAVFLAVILSAVCILAASGGSKAASGAITVVVDAGHGGVDAGAVGVNGSHESSINLSVAKKLEERLKSCGINVVMTRETEDGLYGLPTDGFKRRDMRKRKEIIEQAQPNLVVSIHMNKSDVASVRGAQVFYHKGSKLSEKLAACLQTSLNASSESKPRTALTGDYYMLNCTSFTSVIVECGFLSNSAEEKLLADDGYRDKLAQSITEGIMAYLTEASDLKDLYREYV